MKSSEKDQPPKNSDKYRSPRIPRRTVGLLTSPLAPISSTRTRLPAKPLGTLGESSLSDKISTRGKVYITTCLKLNPSAPIKSIQHINNPISRWGVEPSPARIQTASDQRCKRCRGSPLTSNIPLSSKIERSKMAVGTSCQRIEDQLKSTSQPRAAGVNRLSRLPEAKASDSQVPV